MPDILLVLTKYANENTEKTIIHQNGLVTIETVQNGELIKKTKTITIANELEEKLKQAYEKMLVLYGKEKNSNYIVTYNDHDFYSFDLFIDLMMMVRDNKIKPSPLFEKEREEKQQEENLEKRIHLLDEMEQAKQLIDIEDIEEVTDFNEERKIISFTLDQKTNFALGESRFFSNTIDIAEGVEIPQELEYIGQLNLEEMAPYDSYGLLPKSGMLYFYQSPLFVEDHFYNFGKVIYSDSHELTRKNIHIEEDMVLNLFIKEIKQTKENFNDRFENGEYKSFKGDDVNKVYGFYTDCQMDEHDIFKISQKYVVLLQLGSDIYGEGVTSFLIEESDLKEQNFDKIIYKYVQS